MANQDAVWVDVLPSMQKFFPTFAKEAGPASEKAGLSAAQGFASKFTAKGSSLLRGSMGSLIGISSAAGIATGIVNIGKTFEDLRNHIAKSTGASGKNLDDLMGVARNVSTQSAASYEDIGTAVAGLHQRLDLTGKPLQDMSKQMLQLSSITKTDLSTNIANSASMFNKWGISTQYQSGMLDQLYRASTASGVSITDLSSNVTKFQPTLQGMGFSLQASLGLFAEFGKSGISSQQVMSGMTKAYGTFAKAGKSAPKAMADLTQKIKDAKSPTEATSLAVQTFGAKAGPALAGAIRSGKMNLDQMLNTIRNGKTTIAGTTAETATMSGKWTILSHTLKNAAAPAAMGIMDGLTKLAATLNQKLTPGINAFTKGWQDNTGAGGKARQEFDAIGTTIQRVGRWISQHTTTVKNLAIGMGALLLVVKATTAATKAQEVGYVVMKGVLAIVSGAQKAYAAAQWLVNAAMSANPIALIIIGLVALGAAFVVAWKKSATFRAVVIGVWNGIKAISGAVWTWLKNSVLNPIGYFFGTTIPNAARTMGRVVGSVWNGIKGVAGAVWNWLKAWVINPIVNYFRVTVPNAFRNFGSVFSSVWNGAKNAANSVWLFLKNRVFSPLVNFLGTMKLALSSFGTHFKNVWNGLKALAGKPVNFIINTVWNNGLRKALNLIPGVNLKAAKTIGGWRSGGYTGNGDPADVAGPVHKREFVMDADTTARAGGPSAMERLRAGIRAGLWPVGPEADLMGANNQNASRQPSITGSLKNVLPTDLRSVISKGPGSNAVGFGSEGTDAAAWGLAHLGTMGWYRLCLAFVNDAWGHRNARTNVATARMAMNAVPRRTDGNPPPGAYVFFNTHSSAGHVALSEGDGSILSNDIVTPGSISRVTIPYLASHWNAPYMGWWSPDGEEPGAGGASWLSKLGSLLGKAGSAVGDTFSSLWSSVSGKLSAVKNAALKGLNTPWGRLLRGVPDYAVSKAESWAKSKLSSLFGSGSSGASGSAVQIGQQLAAARGWTGSQWSALYQLWEHESNWNPLANNSSSGAYGIPQSLPGSKMASAGSDWKTNPATQVKWGLAYIASRYGTPARAWSMWQARSPHWYEHGTSSASSGLAYLAENGMAELVTSPQARVMSGGERVYSSSDTRRILGGGSGDMRIVGGQVEIKDGNAYFYNVALQAVEDSASAQSRRSFK